MSLVERMNLNHNWTMYFLHAMLFTIGIGTLLTAISLLLALFHNEEVALNHHRVLTRQLLNRVRQFERPNVEERTTAMLRYHFDRRSAAMAQTRNMMTNGQVRTIRRVIRFNNNATNRQQ